MDDEKGCAAALSVALITFILGCIIGCGVQDKIAQSQAILHGSAKWVITDEANGTVAFKWNDELTTGGMTNDR